MNEENVKSKQQDEERSIRSWIIGGNRKTRAQETFNFFIVFR